MLIALIALIVILWGFMTLLCIIGAILLLIVLIMLIPVTLDIKTDEELCVTLKVAFVKIKLVPKREKPIRLKDYRIKAFRKRRLREQREYLQKNRKKSADKAKKTETSKDKPKAPIKERAEDALDLVKHVILRGVKRFGRHLRINVYRMRIFVGGSEPDKTAITYGLVCQGVSYVTEILDTHLNVKYPGKAEHRIYVGADFSSPKTVTDIHISLRIRMWHLPSSGISALIGYMTMPKRKREDKATNDIKSEMNPAKAGTEV